LPPHPAGNELERLTSEEIMRKVLGLALAMTFTLTMVAAAEEVKGTVKTIDRTSHSIVLDDGTMLTVSDSQINNLTAGDQVRAMYHVEGGKQVVTDVEPRGIGSDDRGTTNWGPNYGTEMNSIQAE
jgi:Cu/Ag efflux protein CusF